MTFCEYVRSTFDCAALLEMTDAQRRERWLLSEHFSIQRMGVRTIADDSIAAQAIARFSVGRMVRG